MWRSRVLSEANGRVTLRKKKQRSQPTAPKRFRVQEIMQKKHAVESIHKQGIWLTHDVQPQLLIKAHKTFMNVIENGDSRSLQSNGTCTNVHVPDVDVHAYLYSQGVVTPIRTILRAATGSLAKNCL